LNKMLMRNINEAHAHEPIAIINPLGIDIERTFLARQCKLQAHPTVSTFPAMRVQQPHQLHSTQRNIRRSTNIAITLLNFIEDNITIQPLLLPTCLLHEISPNSTSAYA